MLVRNIVPLAAIILFAATISPPNLADEPAATAPRGFCPEGTRQVVHAAYRRASSTHEPTIVAKAASTGTFRTLINALVAADLLDTLEGSGPFTVFAPNDDAFGRLSARELSALLALEGKEKLRTILSLHVVPGKLKASALVSKGRVKALSGSTLSVAENRRGIAVNDALVVKANIECGNGVIHVIDRVLTPAPSPTDILGLASSKRSFGVLVTAIKAAGLEEALKGDGPFTLLAPTDEAFAKLPQETLASLLKPANRDALARILKFHVIPAKLDARALVAADRTRALEGGEIKSSIEDGRLVVNGARVLATDLHADNGIIHAIDTVLMPH